MPLILWPALAWYIAASIILGRGRTKEGES